MYNISYLKSANSPTIERIHSIAQEILPVDIGIAKISDYIPSALGNRGPFDITETLRQLPFTDNIDVILTHGMVRGNYGRASINFSERYAGVTILDSSIVLLNSPFDYIPEGVGKILAHELVHLIRGDNEGTKNKGHCSNNLASSGFQRLKCIMNTDDRDAQGGCTRIGIGLCNECLASIS